MSAIKLIRTEEEYERAIERLELLFDAPQGSTESDEADVLALLIEVYEAQHYEIPSPDPIAAIKIRMEEMNLKQKDLIGDIGSKSVVSEVLSKKRRLTIKMVRNLSIRLQLGVDLLIKDYALEKSDEATVVS